MTKDNVKCCNCNFDGVVDFSSEQCPECKETGYLSWEDEEKEVVL